MQFRNAYSSVERTICDCSNPMQPQFIEVAPLATYELMDVKTGEVTSHKNNSVLPITIPSEPINVDEMIQSFRDDSDIYKIMERCVASQSLDPAKICTPGYGDVTMYPQDPHEMSKLISEATKLRESMDVYEARLKEKQANAKKPKELSQEFKNMIDVAVAAAMAKQTKEV